MTVAEPLALTDEIVVLRREAYDALIEARASGGAEYVPIELADRIFAGEHPIRVWREYRGLNLRALSEEADIAPGYLSEIEAGKKPGSVRALVAIANTLHVGIKDLLTED